MAEVFQHWYNVNENRAYPCHDDTSRIDTGGNRLPDNVIADLNIWIPELAGTFVYISSVTVSPQITSVTFVAVDYDPLTGVGADGVLVASIAVIGSVVKHRNYELTTHYPGVGGWVVFGSGVDSDGIAMRFDPAATVLTRRASRHYRGLPISSAKKQHSAELTGVVTLLPGNDIYIRGGVRTIDGIEEDVILIGLDTRDDTGVLNRYLGECDGRPESGTCGRTPIEFINTVPPDCYGNIEIEFDNWEGSSPGEPDSDNSLTEHGIVLDLSFGLSSVCPERLSFTDITNLRVGEPYAMIVFTIPSDDNDDDLTFQIQFAEEHAFSTIVASFDSAVSEVGWSYWTGTRWEQMLISGVTFEYYGNDGRFSTRYTADALVYGTLYWYRIRAYDGANYGAWSSPKIYYLRK